MRMLHIAPFLFYLGFCCLVLPACTEFLSQNVEEVSLEINSPSDSLFNGTGQMTFWWEPHSLVEQYRLRVIQPDFSNPSFIFDTLMTGTQLQLDLTEGRYVWQVRAENQESESAFQTSSFVMDQTAPQVPESLSPQSNALIDVSDEEVILTWRSQDLPVDGLVFSTQDSIYLSLAEGDQEIASFFRAQQEETSWNITDILTSYVQEDSLQISWRIVSYDLSGNREMSESFTFYIQR